MQLCENCYDPEFPNFCYNCSLDVRNGDTPKKELITPKDNIVTYLFIKFFSAVISVPVSTGIIVLLLVRPKDEWHSFFYFFGFASFFIVILFGVPISLVIDKIIKYDKGVHFIIKTISHGIAGIIVAGCLFSYASSDWLITLLSGFLNSIIYYFVCVWSFRNLRTPV